MDPNPIAVPTGAPQHPSFDLKLVSVKDKVYKMGSNYLNLTTDSSCRRFEFLNNKKLLFSLNVSDVYKIYCTSNNFLIVMKFNKLGSLEHNDAAKERVFMEINHPDVDNFIQFWNNKMNLNTVNKRSPIEFQNLKNINQNIKNSFFSKALNSLSKGKPKKFSPAPTIINSDSKSFYQPMPINVSSSAGSSTDTGTTTIDITSPMKRRSTRSTSEGVLLYSDLSESEHSTKRTHHSPSKRIKFSPSLNYTFRDGSHHHITDTDFQGLYNHAWLNDSIVDFFLKYFAELAEDNIEGFDSNSYEIFSSFFYITLTRTESNYYENVKKWVLRLDLFKKKFCIIPVIEMSHWYCVIIYGLDKLLESRASEDAGSQKCYLYVFDSLNQNHSNIEKPIKEFLVGYGRDKYNVDVSARNIQLRKSCVLKQPNFNDCGIHVIYNVNVFLNNQQEIIEIWNKPPAEGKKLISKYFKKSLIDGMRGKLRKILRELQIAQFPELKGVDDEEEIEKFLTSKRADKGSDDEDDIVEINDEEVIKRNFKNIESKRKDEVIESPGDTEELPKDAVGSEYMDAHTEESDFDIEKESQTLVEEKRETGGTQQTDGTRETGEGLGPETKETHKTPQAHEGIAIDIEAEATQDDSELVGLIDVHGTPPAHEVVEAIDDESEVEEISSPHKAQILPEQDHRELRFEYIPPAPELLFHGDHNGKVK